MGRNEIKLRRKALTPEEIRGYKNYDALHKRHERRKRFQRTLRFFTYSMLVTIFVLLLITLAYVVVRLQNKKSIHPGKVKTAWVDPVHGRNSN
jgi:uncharacterized BrkB/YihY/UPF0761 family membrane protein